jgi:2-oxoglutarate dehydrogenase E2 component (dihydrolipoamide succinyltransferase)
VTEIRIPKLNNNDQTYTLVEWIAADDKPVESGDALVTLETSKAAEDLVCDEPGLLWHAKPAGSECQPGDVIGWVVPPGTQRGPGAQTAQTAAPPGPSGDDEDELIVTRDAQALIDKLSIDTAALRELGTKVVRAADVERLAANVDSPDRMYRLPAVQQAVARAVRYSHQSIPAAYTVIKVDIGAAQELARQLSMRLRKQVGLPEFLIAAVAPLYQQYPLFFASPKDEQVMLQAEDSHIGLTIDLGTGLFVPVIKNASGRTIEEIAGIVGDFRLSASKGKFSEGDLNGGNFSIALHRDPDIILAIPLIFPGQVCCLALAGAQQEVVMDSAGKVTTRSVANIGLAYDHRFVNGGQVVPFLQSIKERLESPELIAAS